MNFQMLKGVPESIIISMYTFYSVISDKPYLPPEIIELIYSFIIRDYYGKIISKHLYNHATVFKSIKHTIINIIAANSDSIIESSNIEALQILVNSHIPRKYDLNFWANYLQVLSTNINRLRFTYIYNNIGFRSVNGKRLKLVLDLWLQLCKKFNLKIFLQTKIFSKYIRAKHILKMNNYDQYIITPIIIQPFTDTDWVMFDEAREFLRETSRLI